jgi:hypothetical protein
MTQKLENFFNIDTVAPDRSESPDEAQSSIITAPPTSLVELHNTMKDQLSVADRIDKALPQVRGLDVEDRDLDEYANKAMESYDKLMDLGFNMDDRNAGKIFEVASSMMGNAITAKTAKLDKMLKMVTLQLQAAKLANSIKQPEAPSGQGELSTDRNAILNLINQNLKNKDK